MSVLTRTQQILSMCLRNRPEPNGTNDHDMDNDVSEDRDDSVVDPDFKIDDNDNTFIDHLCEDNSTAEEQIIHLQILENLTAVDDEPLITVAAAAVDAENVSVYKPETVVAGIAEKVIYKALHPVKRRTKEEVKYKRLTPQQKTDRDKRKHPMREPCPEKCKKKCSLNFSDEERSQIHQHYWTLDYNSRRKWMAKNVQITAVKRRTVEQNTNYKKNDSRKYYLPKENRNVCVCRRFFLGTLGYSNDSVITELCAAIKRAPMCSAVKENRGVSGNSKRTKDRTLMIEHINSYHPSVSHYRRQNAPNIKYLPRELTIKDMYNDFNIKYPGVCEKELYRQVLKEMHISLCMPKSDACADCLSYETQKTNDQQSDINQLPFQTEEEYNSHKQKASKANEKYKSDGEIEDNDNVRIFSMDLQKVILIPIMPAIKDSYFTSRLVAFNLTFASLKPESKYKNYCAMWHEGVAGRNAENIVDGIFSVFEAERDVKEFIIWTDNCTAQNKNWILYTSLVICVNEDTGPNTVVIRYLTKGHTHMSADGVHGNIEKRLRKIRNVYDYNDLKEVVRSSRKNLQVVDVTIFHKWTKKKRQPLKKNTVDEALTGFLLKNLVEVRFVKGSTLMEYKTDFNDDYRKLDFLQKKFQKQLNKPEILPERGVLTSKKNTILTVLGPLMPRNRLQFWRNLTESNSAVDLGTDNTEPMEDAEII